MKIKLFIGLAAIAILIGLIYVAMPQKTLQPVETEPPSNKSGGEISENIADFMRDDDKDGLLRWEEDLWQTDTSKADTDQDGTSDGEEVKLGRNPTVKGPDDKFDDNIIIKKVAKKKTAEGSNAPKNPPTDSKTVVDITSTSPNESVSVSAEKIALRTFGNTLGRIIKFHISLTKDESQIFEGLIDKPIEETFETLSNLMERYKKTAAALGLVETPKSGEDLRSSLANGYRKQASGLDTLYSYKSSGEIPGLAFQNYNKTVINTGLAIIKGIDFFKSRGIIFNSNEDGAIFSGAL